jgi:hypothetical protein
LNLILVSPGVLGGSIIVLVVLGGLGVLAAIFRFHKTKKPACGRL